MRLPFSRSTPNLTRLVACCFGATIFFFSGANAQPTNSRDYIQVNLGAMTTEQDWWVNKAGWGGSLQWGRRVGNRIDLQMEALYEGNASGGNFYRRGALGVDAVYRFQPLLGGHPELGLGTGASRTSQRFEGQRYASWSLYLSPHAGFWTSVAKNWEAGIEARFTQSNLRKSDALGPSRGNPGMTLWSIGLRHYLR